MISEDDVKKVARLARLEIKDEKKIQKDLASVLSYFEMIGEVDASHVEPTFHPTEKFIDKAARKDEAVEANSESILEAVPDKKGRYVKVKSIL